MIDQREQKGLTIAALSKITQKGKVWLVPSQANTGTKYTVCPDHDNPHCSCPDHELRGVVCKHIHAVRFTLKREENEDGSVTETREITLTETRKTYPQKWAAYNEAATKEKAHFVSLLHQLCRTIQEPQALGKGRPRIPLADAVFAAVYKVYTTVSGRRCITDMNEAKESGYIKHCPHFNSIFNVFEDEKTFQVLKRLIEISAAPLAGIETKFSCDSSGFSGSRYDRWVEHKYGKPMKKVLKVWCKAHIMTGVSTNVVTALEIHDQYANDGVQLKPLLNTTAERFTVKELSADLAYSTHANLEAVDALGALPMIPFKSNASDGTGGLWAKMFHYFQFQKEEFLKKYHLRSNVESTFSMVKRTLGDSVRSKGEVAMKNEVAAKFVAHNIRCLIQAMYELNLTPIFCAETPVAQIVAQN